MDSGSHDRLVNFLARTASEHDGEALTAARKTNRLLQDRRLAWSEVIPESAAGPEYKVPGDDPQQPYDAGPVRQWGDDLFGDQPAAWHQTHGAAHRSPEEAMAHAHHQIPQSMSFTQRLAWVFLWLGIGAGALAGIGVYALMRNSPPDQPVAPFIDGFGPGAIAFAVLSLAGLILWFLFGGMRPRQRMSST